VKHEVAKVQKLTKRVEHGRGVARPWGAWPAWSLEFQMQRSR